MVGEGRPSEVAPLRPTVWLEATRVAVGTSLRPEGGEGGQGDRHDRCRRPSQAGARELGPPRRVPQAGEPWSPWCADDHDEAPADDGRNSERTDLARGQPEASLSGARPERSNGLAAGPRVRDDGEVTHGERGARAHPRPQNRRAPRPHGHDRRQRGTATATARARGTTRAPPETGRGEGWEGGLAITPEPVALWKAALGLLSTWGQAREGWEPNAGR